MKLCILFIASVLLAFVSPTAKRKLLVDKALSTVTYQASHPMHNWEGVSRDLNCAVTYNDDTRQIENIAVAIKISSFDSGNGNRDSHAMEVLDGLKYPNVTFVSADVKVAEDGTLRANGNLTFHGVTRPVSLRAIRKDAGGRMTLTGEFPISMADYKIERPSLLGLKTEDGMKLIFKAVFNL